MNLQGTRYALNIKAYAIELIVYYNYNITEVASIIGCGVNTISKWYSDYLGYRGDEKGLLAMPSIINNISDNREYQ